MGDPAEVRGEWSTAVDLLAAERLGGDRLRDRRRARVDALLRTAHAGSPLYRKLHADVVGRTPGLADLPVTTKPDLMAGFDDWLTDRTVSRADVERFIADLERAGVPFRGRYFVCTTSGTTGRPGLFVYDRRAITVFRAMMLARIDAHWLSAGDLVGLARRRFRWAAVVGAGAHFAGAGWMELERSRSRWRSRAYRVVPLDLPMSEIVDVLNSFQPAILTTYPSVLDMLVEEQVAGRLSIGPVFVETSGETADVQTALRARAAFGCPVHDAYACSEFMFMAFGCPHGWLHVNSDWVILEPVDRDLRPTPHGEESHTVLLTNLANHVQPLIRYDLGDSVVVRPDPCPCGIRLPAIRVSGRRDDVMHLADAGGRRVAVAPLAIGSVVEEVPGVLRCQLVQHAPAGIRIRVEARSGADLEVVRRESARSLRHFLAGIGLGAVSVEDDPAPPLSNPRSGKFRQVIVEPGSEAQGTG